MASMVFLPLVMAWRPNSTCTKTLITHPIKISHSNQKPALAPVAVAQTHRVLFAKKLIDETTLSLSQVALSAGFSSIRRFNGAIRSTYGVPPRELRRATRTARVRSGGFP